jgi:transposase-like protein
MIKNLPELMPYLADEAKARELFERIRWPEGPVCPHCGSRKAYKVQSAKARPGVYKCATCRKQFTATVGTVFEGSHIPLSKWLYAVFLMCSSKKGVSAKQLERELNISYKAAWFMCHRVRYAMTQPALAGKIGGGENAVVEADETYIGGKAENNKHKGYKAKPKPIVVALIDRKGDTRTFPVPNSRRGTLQYLVKRNVESTAHIVTDGHKSYRGLEHHFAGHAWVDHDKQFVRGLIHTNFAESYFSLLKRGIFGTFHHVSEQHLPRYLREF